MSEPVLAPLNQGTFNRDVPPGTNPGRSDHYPMYDRLRLDSTLPPATERVLFNQNVRSTRDGVVLTYADTNNDYGDRVPDTQSYVYYWLDVYMMMNPAQMDEEGLEAYYDIIRQTYISFTITNLADIFILPLWKFFGAQQSFAVPTASLIQQPTPNFSGQWKLQKPITLEAGSQSYLSVFLPGGTSPAVLNGSFIGYSFEAKRNILT